MTEIRYNQELLEKALDKKYKGCLTCRRYQPLKHELVDVEEGTEDEESELFWILCDSNPDSETPLKINCKDWKEER